MAKEPIKFFDLAWPLQGEHPMLLIAKLAGAQYEHREFSVNEWNNELNKGGFVFRELPQINLGNNQIYTCRLAITKYMAAINNLYSMKNPEDAIMSDEITEVYGDILEQLSCFHPSLSHIIFPYGKEMESIIQQQSQFFAPHGQQTTTTATAPGAYGQQQATTGGAGVYGQQAATGGAGIYGQQPTTATTGQPQQAFGQPQYGQQQQASGSQFSSFNIQNVVTKVFNRLQLLDAIYSRRGNTGFANTKSVSAPDVLVFCILRLFESGLVQGVDINALNQFSQLMLVKKNVQDKLVSTGVKLVPPRVSFTSQAVMAG